MNHFSRKKILRSLLLLSLTAALTLSLAAPALAGNDPLPLRAIAAGDYFTVGLRADGTVVAAGHYDYGECNVENWRNIRLPG